MTAYLRQALHHQHPDIRVRDDSELVHLAEALDYLVQGDVVRASDLLMQRFRSVEAAVKAGELLKATNESGNRWVVAKHLEVRNTTDVTATNQRSLNEAAKVALEQAKMAKTLRNAGASKSG